MINVKKLIIEEKVSKNSIDIAVGTTFTGEMRKYGYAGLFMAYPKGLILFRDVPVFLGLGDMIIDDYKEVDIEITY